MKEKSKFQFISDHKLSRPKSFVFKKDNDTNKNIVINFLKQNKINHYDNSTIHSIGKNILHIQSYKEIPYPSKTTLIYVLDKDLGIIENVPIIYSRHTGKPLDFETNKFLWAYDLNNDDLPEFKYTSSNRYAAFDYFYSLDTKGLHRCSIRVASSD